MRSFDGVSLPRPGPRTEPRPRHAVGPRAYRLAQRIGFRYSATRNALVLRGVGHRWGPVLRLDDKRSVAVFPPPWSASADGPAPAGAPDGGLRRSARTAAAARTDRRASAVRTIDVACLPLPRLHRGQPLWQLVAVDVGTGFVWADVARTHDDGAPSTPAAVRFVREVAEDLAALGLTLGAIVVRDGSLHRGVLLDGATAGDVELLHEPPDDDRAGLAARTHDRLVASCWCPLFAAADAYSLTALRREQQQWVDAHNVRAATGALRACVRHSGS